MESVYYEWRVTQAKAEAAIRALCPWLRIRREHADVALMYRESLVRTLSHNQQIGTVPGDAAVREQSLAAIRRLNARGIAAPLRRLGPGEGFPEAEEMAYLAGLFDAEGTVTWINDRTREQPLLHIGVMGVVDTACWRFALRFGGNVNHVKRAGRGIFSWYLRQRQARLALTALVPYLREKRAAAEAALATAPTVARRRLRAVGGTG